jgi:N-acetylmuramoyl-L-alanine amidase
MEVEGVGVFAADVEYNRGHRNKFIPWRRLPRRSKSTDMLNRLNDIKNLAMGLTPIQASYESPSSRVAWFINPGHGRLQAGKRSPVIPKGEWRDIPVRLAVEFDCEELRFFEWWWNRQVAHVIVRKLRDENFEAYNVVPEVNVGMFPQRVTRANRKNTHARKKAWVGIHSNAFGDGWNEVGGIETLRYPGSREGKIMSFEFQKELLSATGFRDRGVKDRKDLFELKRTSMPAVITETGFFTNKEECLELLTWDMIYAVADAHVNAIIKLDDIL